MLRPFGVLLKIRIMSALFHFLTEFSPNSLDQVSIGPESAVSKLCKLYNDDVFTSELHEP